MRLRGGARSSHDRCLDELELRGCAALAYRLTGPEPRDRLPAGDGRRGAAAAERQERRRKPTCCDPDGAAPIAGRYIVDGLVDAARRLAR